MERAHHSEELTAWMHAMAETIRATNSDADLEKVQSLIARHVVELLDFSQCAITVLQPDGETLRLTGSHGLSSEYIAWWNDAPMRLDEGTTSTGPPTVRAILSGRPAFSTDVFEETSQRRWSQRAEREGFRAVASVPLFDAQDKAIGTITAYSTVPRTYPPSLLRGLTLLAEHASAALYAAKRRDNEADTNRQLSLANARLSATQERNDRLHSIQRELMKLLLRGVGLDAMAELLATELAATVVIRDQEGMTLAAAPQGSPLAQQIEQVMLADRAGASDVDDMVTAPDGLLDLTNEPWLAVSLVPAPSGNANHAYLWAARSAEESFDDDERWVIEGCALLIALECSRVDQQAQAEARLATDLLADLLSPAAMMHPDSVMARATVLGFVPHQPHALCMFVPVPTQAHPDALGNLVAALARACRAINPPAVLGAVGNSVVVLVPDEDTGNRPRSLPTLLRAADQVRGISTKCLIGPSLSSLADVQPALEVTARASHLLTESSPAVLDLQDLGIYGLLLESGTSTTLQRFAEMTVRELLDADRGELLKTLQVWLSMGASIRATAEAMYVHYNTVSYRLKRISEVTGLDLSDHADLMRLQLALMVHEIRGSLPLNGNATASASSDAPGGSA
jgi:sugar diacid utilization regulator/GAF domain-containing protein